MARYGQQSLNHTTGPDDMVPAMLINDITASAANKEVMMPLVRRIDCTGAGDIFTLPTAPALAFAQLGSATYMDATLPSETAFATGARTFTPTPYFLDVMVKLDVLNSAQMSVPDAIMKEAGIALADHRDTLLLLTYTEAPTSPDHELDYSAAGLNFTALKEASKLLYVQKAPQPFAWVVYPGQWGELMSDSALIDAAFKGSPVITNGIGANGFATKVFDVNIYVSPDVALSTTYRSMMFSSGPDGALAWAYKNLTHPVTGETSELLVDLDWNSGYRALEVNMTYMAVAGGTKATSTTNNWMVEVLSAGT